MCPPRPRKKSPSHLSDVRRAEDRDARFVYMMNISQLVLEI